MRAIKFRAWDKVHKRMFPVTDLKISSSPIEDNTVTTWVNVDGNDYILVNNENADFLLCGGVDKNKAEFYDGDLVKMQSGDIRKIEVKYGNAFWLTSIKSNGNHPLWFYDIAEREIDFEVIGNVFEQPELIKEG